MITPDQCRAARSILRLSQKDLADKTDLSVVSIRNFENQLIPMREATIQRIKLALEAAGVKFIPANGDGPGVQLKKKKPD